MPAEPVPAAPPQGRFLVLVRAGASSLHGSYVGGERTFDFAVSSFVEEPPNIEGALFVDRIAGPKWSGLLASVRAHWDLISKYDYVWLPDDDLQATAQAINRLFESCAGLQLDLAQPALTPDSYFSHLITLEHLSFSARFTNFIELMAPLGSLSQLERMLPTLGGAISGWGLDYLWPRLSCLGRVAIIDDALVKHTRPVGGPSYAHSQSAGISPAQEMQLNAARYGIDAFVPLNLGAIGRDRSRYYLTERTQGTDRMIGALADSVARLRPQPPASEVARYLGHHMTYARNEPLGELPNRAFLQAALDLELSRLAPRG